jgi:hypothetical protein
VEIHDDDGNAEALRETKLLNLSCGEDHFGLQLGGPYDWAAGIVDNVAGPGLGGGRIIHVILLEQ